MHLRTARPNGSAWFVLVLTLMFAGERLAAEEHWARFRGPAGTGIHEAKGFPVKWTQNDYAWKTPIPGVGHSSPCVWGDHVFLTTALYDGRKRATLAYSAATGKLLWQDDFASKSHEKHVLNSYASATPACDGQRVYTLFTNDDQVLVRALDMDGKLVWQEDLGRFFNRHNHGCGTSPIVFEDSVILSIQHDGESYVVALDSATGKERWRNRRQSQLTGHATPAVIQEEGDEPRLLFTNTGDGVASLDPPDRQIAMEGECVSGSRGRLSDRRSWAGLCDVRRGRQGTLLSRSAPSIEGRGDRQRCCLGARTRIALCTNARCLRRQSLPLGRQRRGRLRESENG